MKVFAFPKAGCCYNDKFYEAVEAGGVKIEEGVYSGRWLMHSLRRGDVVHFHWPSFCYASAKSAFGLCVNFLRFAAILLLIRARGCRLFWTAHNVLPHDRVSLPYLDVLGRRLLIALSDRIFVHGKQASHVLVAAFPATREKLVEIQHGNWIGYYPAEVSREEARRILGLDPDEFVYLFIGLCKEYKNVDGLIRTFMELPARSVLIVAGKFQSAAYHSLVEELARRDERVRLEPRYIPDAELQNFLKAADAVVMPYRDILTSGTAMLALSFGRPVVSVRLGCLIDTVTDETGVLYEPGDPHGLARALAAVRKHSFSEQAILNHARRFEWKTSARAFLSAL